MLCEIISEGDGEFVNGDGTFRAAGRVMDDSGCLHFVMGDDGKIQAYAAVKSESEAELLPLFKRCASFLVFVEISAGIGGNPRRLLAYFRY